MAEEIGTRKSSDLFFGHSTRYVVLVIATIALSFVMANSLALNFSVLCMMEEGTDSSTQTSWDEAKSSNESEPIPLYSAGERSWLFSAIAIGNLIGTVPLTYCTHRFGVRVTFLAYGLLSGLSTLFLPASVLFGFWPVFMIRVLQGFGLAISLSSLGAIVSSWSSLAGSGAYISMLSTHIQFGAIIVMPLSGMLCESSLGWPAIYYVLGVLTILLIMAFFLFYRDDPALHRNVSEKELSAITKGRILASTHTKPPVPYRAILTDVPVIGVLISCFGGSLGLQIMFQYGPTFLNQVMGMDLRASGLAAAFPYVLAVGVKIVAGPFSDMFTCLSERGRIIFFNSMSQFPMCLCFVLMAVLPMELAWLIQIAYSLVNAFSGLNAVGVAKCVQLISQHHSHFIMAIMGCANSLAILVLPPVMSLVCPDNTPQQWARMFFGITVVILVTTFFFNFTCRAEPRPWTADTTARSSKICPADTPPSVSDLEQLKRNAAHLADAGVIVQFEPAESANRVFSAGLHALSLRPVDTPVDDRPIGERKTRVSLVL